MKKIYVDSLETGTMFDDFFLMKSVTVRTGANQKQFLDMMLSDRTGDVNAKKWDATPEEVALAESFEDNIILKVRANVNEWQGRKQLKVTRFREAVPEDGFSIEEFIKKAPEEGEAMYEEILGIALTVEDPELRSVAVTLMEREKERLLYYPAASKNHHAEMSGLLYHMKRMLRLGEKACEVYASLSRDWVVTGVIIHDIEKLNEILSNKWGISPGYSMEGQLLGHIAMGVKRIDRLAAELEISEEKAILLEHMILSHHYEPEFGSPKRPMFPEAELLHYLDIIDSRLFDMEDALQGVAPGDFSEKIWTLDQRRIYKPTFEK